MDETHITISSSSTNSPLLFSNEQQHILDVSLRICSAFSMFGSLSMILSYTIWKDIRSVSNQLVFYLAISNFLSSLFMVFGRLPATSNVHLACEIQAVGLQASVLSSAMWITTIAINLLTVLIFRRSPTDIKTIYYHLVNWTVPLAIACILPIFHTESQGPVYTDSLMWCWISEKYPVYRIVFFFAPIWFMFYFNLVVYVYIGYIVWKSSKSTQEMTKFQTRPSKINTMYVKKVSLYLISFCIIWAPPTINRIQNMIDPEHPIFALYFLHITLEPLEGFICAIIYFWPNIRSQIKRIREASGGDESMNEDNDDTNMSSSASGGVVNSTNGNRNSGSPYYHGQIAGEEQFQEERYQVSGRQNSYTSSYYTHTESTEIKYPSKSYQHSLVSP